MRGASGRSATSVVLLRYLAFQVPGWILAACLLFAASRWWTLPGWLGPALLLALVVKDCVLFPFVRDAYEPHSGGGAAALIGRTATARDPLRPEGYVRLAGELWRAELAGGGEVPAGARVRVVAVRGLTLLVETEEA